MRSSREEIRSVFEKGKTNTWAVENTVSWEIGYNLAESNSVIAERMQNTVGSDSGSSFPLADIMFDKSDKLLCTPLWTAANTCIQKLRHRFLLMERVLCLRRR